MNVVSLFLISELRQSIDNPAVVPLVVAYVLGASFHGDIALSAASVFSVHGNGMFTVVSAYLMQSFIIVFLSVFIRGHEQSLSYLHGVFVLLSSHLFFCVFQAQRGDNSTVK